MKTMTMMLLKTAILQIHGQGRQNVKKMFLKLVVEEPASVEAEPPEKKGKEKKEREPTLFELYYDPSVNPYMFPDGKPVPKGYVYDGVRLVKERKGSKESSRVPNRPVAELEPQTTEESMGGLPKGTRGRRKRKRLLIKLP